MMRRVLVALVLLSALLVDGTLAQEDPVCEEKECAEKASGPNIEVIQQPSKEFLQKKGVFEWDTWECDVSTFDWTYEENESCYFLAGKVTVTPDDGRPAATFGKGDFVTFPTGMSCTWEVSEAVEKHYLFY